ncbi:MAG: polyphosphate kinase 1 [Bacteriovoracaceae bacterium]|nr:polyphosphate kinase 1 [Bacteriovoracaceae bacterium]
MKRKKKNFKAGPQGDHIQYENIRHEIFLNREFSWLEFNERVLFESQNKKNPLFERLRFLMIFTSNLDEFIMKRAGGLREQIAVGYSYLSVDGKTPKEQLQLMRDKIKKSAEQQHQIFKGIIKELAEKKINILDWSELDEKEKKFAIDYYKNQVFPVLTPLSVDPGHPFPFISNLSLSLGIRLRNPQVPEKVYFSRLKIPDALPSLIKLPSNKNEYRFIRTEEMVEQNLNFLFPGMDVLSSMLFRVTRNAELAHDDEDAEDLLEVVEESLRERRFAECIRLEHLRKQDKWILKFLKNELELKDEDVYESEQIIDYTKLKPLLDLDFPELKYPQWTPVVPRLLGREVTQDIFKTIKDGDILIHHPYESFNASVERFIRNAASDPDVLAIKMTLYRTGDNSPIVNALIRAAEKGKQVVCLIELKARFDEQRNIHWAQQMEDAGVHVVYGILGLKTHTKISLVVRRENKQIVTYAHIGTGNYNSQTTSFYTDLGLLTCRPQICAEVLEVFNYITGKSLKTDYEQLLVAPLNMKSTFLNLIQKEISNIQNGKPAYIFAKMNQMEDVAIIQKLYEASQAGVKIDLFVRGFCCLRPGVAGLSENIKVISVIGRFLEHSRLYYFSDGNAELVKGKIFMGSADWMHRNLHNRVEVITPIIDEPLKQKILQHFELLKNDTNQSWLLNSDGTYQKLAIDETKLGIHDQMMKQTIEREKNVTLAT